MGGVWSTDKTIECRLHAAADGGAPVRVVHLESLPSIITLVEDDLGLEAIYRLISKVKTDDDFYLATYLFDHLS